MSEIPELAKGGIGPADSPALHRIADDVVECLIPLAVYDRLVPRESGRSIFGSPDSVGWSATFRTLPVDGDELAYRKALQVFMFGPVNPHAALVLVPKGERFWAVLSWQMSCAAAAMVASVDTAVGPLTQVMQFLADVRRQWRDEDWAARKRRGGAMRDYRRKTRRRNRRRRG